jgi:hypothetical protein
MTTIRQTTAGTSWSFIVQNAKTTPVLVISRLEMQSCKF